jgi:hypothetical protein
MDASPSWNLLCVVELTGVLQVSGLGRVYIIAQASEVALVEFVSGHGGVAISLGWLLSLLVLGIDRLGSSLCEGLAE